MFSAVNTNIYKKKTKGPTLMELVHSHRKTENVLEMFDMCITGDTAHIDTIFNFLTHTRQHVSTWSLHSFASPSGRNVNYDKK
jgi:hypothetical protein